MDVEEVKTDDYTDYIDITDNKSVLKKIIEVGENRGSPALGTTVNLRYTATLEDGTLFDSSADHGDNLNITLKKGSLIKGFEAAILSMTKNEKSRFIVQPTYAYGKEGLKDKVPPSSTLVYEITLLDWKLDDLTLNKDGGVLFQIIKKGDGRSCPKDGATVDVHISGFYNSTMFDQRSVSFILGEGINADIVEGIELALPKFKRGTKALLKLSSKYAFGEEGKQEWSIPPGADVEYEVLLSKFEKAKEMWEVSSEERIEQAEEFKNKGNQYFSKKNLKLAVKQYNKVLEFIDQEFEQKGELDVKRLGILLSSNLNLALCYQKEKEYFKAVKACERALDIDPKNIKAFYRKGQAKMEMNEFDVAQYNFEKVLELDPSNKSAKNLGISCGQKHREYLKKEKNTYKNMFEKFATEDKSSHKNEPLPRPDFWFPNADENARMEENLELGAALLDETIPNIDRAPA